MDINKDLIAASSTPIVLAILAEEDSYGYAILQRVRELSGGRMEWTDGMLYRFCIGSSGSATSRRGGKLRRAAAVASTTGSRPGARLSSRRNADSGKRWTLRYGASGRRSPFPSRPATRRQLRHCHREPERCRLQVTRYRSRSRSTDGGATSAAGRRSTPWM